VVDLWGCKAFGKTLIVFSKRDQMEWVQAENLNKIQGDLFEGN
jgi:hypothetical protein